MTSFSAPLRQQTGAARLRLKLLAASRWFSAITCMGGDCWNREP